MSCGETGGIGSDLPCVGGGGNAGGCNGGGSVIDVNDNGSSAEQNGKLMASDFQSMIDATATQNFLQSMSAMAGVTGGANVENMIGHTIIGKGGTPLDLSKSTPKYERSESEISFSDSNNEHDESNDYLVTNSKDGSSSAYFFENDKLSGELFASGGGGGGNGNSGVGGENSNINGNGGGDPDTNNDQFDPCSPASSTQSMQKKRYRTQMSNVQVQILRVLFRDFKTPSMIDCENIGREIGLPKRVVQVRHQI